MKLTEGEICRIREIEFLYMVNELELTNFIGPENLDFVLTYLAKVVDIQAKDILEAKDIVRLKCFEPTILEMAVYLKYTGKNLSKQTLLKRRTYYNRIEAYEDGSARIRPVLRFDKSKIVSDFVYKLGKIAKIIAKHSGGIYNATRE